MMGIRIMEIDESIYYGGKMSVVLLTNAKQN
jgi:hypothetical protein